MISSNCREHDMSKIASIKAYPVGTLEFRNPVYANMAYAASVSIPDDGYKNISYLRDTVQCSEKHSAGVAASVHEVSLTWDTKPMTEQEYDTLLALQNTPHEFVIRYFGGVTKVIRTSTVGYQFLFSDDGGVTKCSLSVANGQGLTHIL